MDPPGRIELPSAFEHADIDHLVILIADMLERLIEHNDKIPLSPESLTRFHSRSPPSITVLEYLRRIVKYANMERTCLLITLHYIDQICARLPHFTLSSLTCHRFVITATVVASKALCDSFCTNAHYAKVGGLRTGELNMLERELLCAIDWRLTTTREVLDAYYINLVRTNSPGAYTIAAPPAPEHATSPDASTGDADSDMDSVRCTSPVQPPMSNHNVHTMPTESGAVPIAAATFATETSSAASSHVRRMNEHNARARAEGAGLVQGSVHTRDGTVASAGTAVAASRLFGPSTVLRERATLSPRMSAGPTFEQNMAFAALREPAPDATVGVPPSTSADVVDASGAGHGGVAFEPEVLAEHNMLSSSVPSPGNDSSPALSETSVTLSMRDANAMWVSESSVSRLSTNPMVDENQVGSLSASPSRAYTPDVEHVSRTRVLLEAGTQKDSHKLASVSVIESGSINASAPAHAPAPPSVVPHLPTRLSLDSSRELLNKRLMEDTLSEPEDAGPKRDMHYLSPRPRVRPRT